MNEILNQAERLRRELSEAVAGRCRRFRSRAGGLQTAARAAESNRRSAWPPSNRPPCRPPKCRWTVAQKAVTVMALAERCAALGNLNAISDAASAAALAQAALTSAGYNVRINVNGLSDKTTGEALLAQLQALEVRARKLEKDLHKR